MTLPPLAQVADLEIRLGLDPGTLAGNDLARAQADIADASALVRTEARTPWVDASGNVTAPETVTVVVLQVAMRVYNNPNGLASETVSADGASYSASNNQQALGIYLTDDEKEAIRLALLDDATAVPSAWRGTGSILTPKPGVRGPVAGFLPWVWRP